MTDRRRGGEGTCLVVGLPRTRLRSLIVTKPVSKLKSLFGERNISLRLEPVRTVMTKSDGTTVTDLPLQTKRPRKKDLQLIALSPYLLLSAGERI